MHMVSTNALVYRGSLIESKHVAEVLVKDTSDNNIISTNNIGLPIYPRSSIKIFQALPFINSDAHNIFNLKEENIAIACSSHIGESMHIDVLKLWLNKIDLKIDVLKCGIHNPIDEKSLNNLFIKGQSSTQLHNNCSGKHLGMISGCLANKMEIDTYTEYSHPYQKLIRTCIENFMQTTIKDHHIGVDGCSAPQYAFPLENVAISMVNLIKTQDAKNEYSKALNIILRSINKHPLLIGGNNRFDSSIIKSTKGRIFCKGGAEGVLLFADFEKKIGGVIKIIDGNYRAIPSIAMQVFLKLKMLSATEVNELNSWTVQTIYNHTGKKVGKIVAELF